MSRKNNVKKKTVGTAAINDASIGLVEVVSGGEVDLSFIGSKDEAAETRTIASRARVRSKMDTEVEEFLRSGGEIDSVAANVMGDPPRKPESNYGSRPI